MIIGPPTSPPFRPPLHAHPPAQHNSPRIEDLQTLPFHPDSTSDILCSQPEACFSILPSPPFVPLLRTPLPAGCHKQCKYFPSFTINYTHSIFWDTPPFTLRRPISCRPPSLTMALCSATLSPPLHLVSPVSRSLHAFRLPERLSSFSSPSSILFLALLILG
ncbi:hypothetical protein FB451DRAFT_1226777 [Mycena latifolia]|nr:hypothetical protein FB451DRAFT_1226777 [Mycena latifolia]